VWTVKGTKAPAAVALGRRPEVLDLMGVHDQLIFPTFALFAIMVAGSEDGGAPPWQGDHSSAELRDLGRAGIAEYNRWVSRRYREDRRLRFVAYLHPGTLSEMLADAEEIVDAGAGAVHVETGTTPGGLSPAAPELDQLYDLLARHDVPLVFHVGGGRGFVRHQAWSAAPAFKPGKIESVELGLQPLSFATGYYSAHNYLSAMVLGGVFERHPTLRLGAIEYGGYWLGPLAETLDMWVREVYSRRLAPFISRKPSEYIADRVRVSPYHFEPVDLYFERHRDLWPCYCFSTDYPHMEGGKESIATFHEKLERFGDDALRAYFVDNATLLFPPHDVTTPS
jgi:predicted TIM-barrel fold metal-dependent hydrolase